MMKSLWIVAVLLVAGQAVCWAEDCPVGTKLRVIGTVGTANDTSGARTGFFNISTTGHAVRKIAVACGGTACVAGLYDSDGEVSTMGNAEVKAEPGAPANEGKVYDFDPPLAFDEGIQFRDDSNVNAVIAYECR